MFVHRAWYRAAWSKELGKDPMHRKFLMQDVALYRDSKGKVHALNAICPHRGANLGEGKVVGDCLQCPFHGLVFNADGHCEKMPFQPDNRPILKQARVTSYPVREQDGITEYSCHPDARSVFFRFEKENMCVTLIALVGPHICPVK